MVYSNPVRCLSVFVCEHGYCCAGFKVVVHGNWWGSVCGGEGVNPDISCSPKNGAIAGKYALSSTTTCTGTHTHSCCMMHSNNLPPDMWLMLIRDCVLCMMDTMGFAKNKRLTN
eukprot:GDKI01005570.1.p1 GENE.GDKI01005570.1~~GDKI01005570.1.p1  ORF type:complete len:114 (-),score=10.04 GDKI01005570.1:123-464(-)